MKPLLPLLAALLGGCGQPKLMRVQCRHADGQLVGVVETNQTISPSSFDGMEDAVCEVSLVKGGRP